MPKNRCTGRRRQVTALPVAVLRRQQDGSWKMVIGHPFADGVMHQE
ncbi:hypothetical protein [Pannonibacter phragmitetus]|nr:hypothetical protein [Pannonibacter phragmitetus]